jgi:hypothetical protein
MSKIFNIENMLFLLVLFCLCALVWASLFVNNSPIAAIVFTIEIIVWLWGNTR